MLYGVMYLKYEVLVHNYSSYSVTQDALDSINPAESAPVLHLFLTSLHNCPDTIYTRDLLRIDAKQNCL